MFTVWAAVIGVTPAIIAAVISVFGQGGTHSRQLERIEKQAAVVAAGGLTPAAKTRLEQLVAREVEDYSKAIDRRDSRTINGSGIAALIFVTAVGGLLGWGAVLLLVAAWPVWYWTVLALVGVLVVFGLTLGLAAAGLTQIYEYAPAVQNP